MFIIKNIKGKKKKIVEIYTQETIFPSSHPFVEQELNSYNTIIIYLINIRN